MEKTSWPWDTTNQSSADFGIGAYDDEDNVVYEDFLDVGDEFEPHYDTYYGPDGGILNVSYYELVEVYSFDEDTANSTEILPVPLPNGRLVALSLFVLLFFIGIAGNALVISTVVRFGNMRKVTYLYLVNLAVADLLYLLVCLPTLTASYVLVEWPFGFFFCRLENYLMSVSMSVSVLTIVATSLDRYLAILHPVKSKPLRTTKIALMIIASMWVISLCLWTGRIHLFDLYSTFNNGWTQLCGRVADQKQLKTDTVVVFLTLYLLPQIILAICHFRIGRKLWRSQRPGFRSAPATQGSIFGIRERRRIAKIMIVITAVFGIGWLPVHLYHLVEDFDYGNILFGEVLDRGMVALFFSFGANSLNPIFYCVFSGAFRKHFKQACLCRRRTLVTSLERVVVHRDDAVQPRTPVVLLPRPASILSSPPSGRERAPFLLEPLLGTDSSRARSSNYDVTPVASPLSMEELTGIRVSDSEQTSSLEGANAICSSSSLKVTSPSLYVQDLTFSGDNNLPESTCRDIGVLNYLIHENPTNKDLKYSQPDRLETTTSLTTSNKLDIPKTAHESEYLCMQEQRQTGETRKQRPPIGNRLMSGIRNFVQRTEGETDPVRIIALESGIGRIGNTSCSVTKGITNARTQAKSASTHNSVRRDSENNKSKARAEAPPSNHRSILEESSKNIENIQTFCSQTTPPISNSHKGQTRNKVRKVTCSSRHYISPILEMSDKEKSTFIGMPDVD